MRTLDCSKVYSLSDLQGLKGKLNRDKSSLLIKELGYVKIYIAKGLRPSIPADGKLSGQLPNAVLQYVKSDDFTGWMLGNTRYTGIDIEF